MRWKWMDGRRALYVRGGFAQGVRFKRRLVECDCRRGWYVMMHSEETERPQTMSLNHLCECLENEVRGRIRQRLCCFVTKCGFGSCVSMTPRIVQNPNIAIKNWSWKRQHFGKKKKIVKELSNIAQKVILICSHVIFQMWSYSGIQEFTRVQHFKFMRMWDRFSFPSNKREEYNKHPEKKWSQA